MVSKVLLASFLATCTSEEAPSSKLCSAGSDGLSRDAALLQARFTHEAAPSDGVEDDWMLDTTMENEWLANEVDGDDQMVSAMSAEERAQFAEAAHQQADAILEEGGDEAVEERRMWTEKFQSVHQGAVNKVKSAPHWAMSRPRACPRHAGAGEISGLYTFGGPGTALNPLTNPLAADGKFPGLRLVTQRREEVRGVMRAYHDPVTFFAGLVCMRHPHMDAMFLPVNSTPEMVPASKKTSSLPRADMGMWFKGHHQDVYKAGFEPHRHAYDAQIWLMLHLARAVDPSVNKHDRNNCALEAAKAGWNLVAQSISTKLHRFDVLIPRDNSSLFQDPVTMACALAFVPTHHKMQYLANLRFTPASFCGIPHVHKGFRDQVRRAIRSPMWAAEVQPKLAACPKLSVAGHSLGAGQAQLVAACLQRAPAEGEEGWNDYKHFRWTPSAAQARVLPAIVR